MGFGKQLNQHLILHSKVVMGKMLLFIGTNDVQKIGFQATYSGQLIKIRLYWVGNWGKWQTFSLTYDLKNGGPVQAGATRYDKLLIIC